MTFEIGTDRKGRRGSLVEVGLLVPEGDSLHDGPESVGGQPDFPSALIDLDIGIPPDAGPTVTEIQAPGYGFALPLCTTMVGGRGG